MRLKVFRLKNGKLEYTGIREVQAGDIIVQGETSMAETVQLRESRFNALNTEILATLSVKEKHDFEAGLRNLDMANPADRVALREAVKRLRPDFTESQLDIFVAGELKPETDDWMAQ